MEMNQWSAAERKVAQLFGDVTRRVGQSLYGSCPVEITTAFVRLCLAQSCGKCSPCRIGLDRLVELLERILAGEAAMQDLDALKRLAETIYDSADCAIGFEAARLVLDGFKVFHDDYVAHIERHCCTATFQSVPCSTGCPAHVDIPGYIALIGDGRYADAVRLIRKDNPLPSVCGLICEHPCEASCRRAVVDAPINIRGLKRYAVEKCGNVSAPAPAPANGKTVGIIGGGPAGLTAAYFLALKGFKVTIYEAHKRLGGMLRYGIPAYRLPDKNLDWDIDVILSLGVEVKYSVTVGRDIAFNDLRKKHDAIYIAIGAHGAKKLRIPGEDAVGVLSAVELLEAMGDERRPDFAGKRVVVVGGGNVAMDATRTARRLGADAVTCVYRRRIIDMTALPEEVAGAQAEGCEMVELMAPVRVETKDDRVTGLVVKPQIPGAMKDSRPVPVDASEPECTLECDIIVVAIGQAIDSGSFAEAGCKTNRGAVAASATGQVELEGEVPVFTGGDCWSGPATVIRAIDTGKVAAANIEQHFGFKVPIVSGVEVPPAPACARLNWGRANMSERPASERTGDFELMEKCLSDEAASQECSRCLRCDHYGRGAFKDGRRIKW